MPIHGKVEVLYHPDIHSLPDHLSDRRQVRVDKVEADFENLDGSTALACRRRQQSPYRVGVSGHHLIHRPAGASKVCDADYYIGELMREVHPSCGEHTGLNRLAHIKAFNDLEQNAVGELTNSIFVVFARTGAVFMSDLQNSLSKEMRYGNV
jgi:hypothetical protein